MNGRRMNVGEIALRPIREEDMEFLFRVYASTRQEELAPVPWSEEMKEAFLRQQFAAQHAYYQEHYAGAAFDVILWDGVAAGRWYVARWTDEIRIVDIALLPEYRGRGVGTRLVGEILAEAGRKGLPVCIHVERDNPAHGWYCRLGFRDVSDHGVYRRMEWRSEAQLKTAS